jgi:hypothetical protein|tara:strand:- start:197 stop:424 length:228 start_codon:yes stop_codon:yes gene_type:complete
MFWRGDPRGGGKRGGSDWPRNGAQLRGEVVTYDGAKWLGCSEIKQKSDSDFTATASPSGSFMPFVYGSSYRLEAA